MSKPLVISIPTKPPFRWVGGKGRLLGTLKQLLPPIEKVERFYEPFVGAGALFFDWGYQAPECYIADACAPLMNAYEQLQEEFDEVWGMLQDYKQHATDYYFIRDEFNKNKKPYGFCKPILAAAQFIALNHMGYNGVYRERKDGGYNVPQGKKGGKLVAKPITLDTLRREELWNAAVRLTDCNMATADFRNWPQTWPLPGLGSVVFIDSPYLAEFSNYNAAGFGEDEHRVLHAQAVEYSERGATVVLCNSNNELTWSIFGKPTRSVQLNRTVGNSLRGTATEAIYVYPPKQ